MRSDVSKEMSRFRLPSSGRRRLLLKVPSSSTKTSDLLKEDSVFAQGILSFAQANYQSSQRSLGDDWLVWIPSICV